MSKLFTVGHSNHSIEEFLEILHTHEITLLVDIRSIPKSRYVPWFNDTALKSTLKKEKINYVHLAELGGRRRTNKDSINTGWHNASFRGFADYMQTEEFFSGFKKLISLIKKNKNVAVMCAEALPWRCHRSLVADAFVVRNHVVWEIISKTSVRKHQLTEFAVIKRDKKPIHIIYPSKQLALYL